jgi:hypothetical protein
MPGRLALTLARGNVKRVNFPGVGGARGTDSSVWESSGLGNVGG